jgi:hypothetical protein
LMPRKLSTLHLLFSNLGARFLNEIFHFLYYSVQKLSLASMAIFNARCMLNCSSCTRPPRLAIVADMLETYKTFVAASNNEIWLLPLPYMLPLPPLSGLQPVSSTCGDAYHDILPQESYCSPHQNVQFRGLWRQMTVSTMAGSHYGQWAIGYVALYGHPLYIIQLIDSCLC